MEMPVMVPRVPAHWGVHQTQAKPGPSAGLLREPERGEGGGGFRRPGMQSSWRPVSGRCASRQPCRRWERGQQGEKSPDEVFPIWGISLSDQLLAFTRLCPKVKHKRCLHSQWPMHSSANTIQQLENLHSRLLEQNVGVNNKTTTIIAFVY